MSVHYPERYQRWEGIRERNTILSLFFSLFGHGRVQPTKCERLQLFFLYASVWYLAYTFSLRRRGNPCRKAWVDACVPARLGGGCLKTGIGATGVGKWNCSSTAVLAKTPSGWDDWSKLSSSTRVGINIEKADCVEAGHSPCSVPMCAVEGPTCEYKTDGLQGFCKCNSWHILVIWDTILYTCLFKLFYMPFWYLFVADLTACVGRCCAVCLHMLVIPFYLIFMLLSVMILWRYMDDMEGFWWETCWWFVSFCILCCFEVVKSFTFGFLLGSYVIKPICAPCGLPGAYFTGFYKFLLA